eukprot:scaffold36875_cov48-Phaeocystis_antarctica.AAC.1
MSKPPDVDSPATAPASGKGKGFDLFLRRSMLLDGNVLSGDELSERASEVLPPPRGMASGMEDAAGRELLSALDERDPGAIRAAMVSYADRVQGVRLQAKAYDLVARLNDGKAAELDKLIAEMRQMAMQRRAMTEEEAVTAAVAAAEEAAAAAAATVAAEEAAAAAEAEAAAAAVAAAAEAEAAAAAAANEAAVAAEAA